MNVKIAIVVLVLVSLGAAFLLFSPLSNSKNEPPTATATDAAPSSPTSMGLYAEENALVTNEQRPGSSVIVNKALLSRPGYVVVHTSENGRPGAILGSSVLQTAREHENVSITLSRLSRDGETLLVMIHAEQNGNTTFDSSTDTAVESKLGGPIMSTIEIRSGASGDMPITI